MAAKITFIGAGSWVFTRNSVRDVLTFPTMADATICLMDIDPERLDFARRAAERIVAAGKYPAKVVTTLNRQEALEGADAVLCTILAGDVDVWRHDIEIPNKYGVDTNIGDTRGPSGIFRALRTIPVMLDICRDMERYLPRCRSCSTTPTRWRCSAAPCSARPACKVTGLCHSVQGTAEMLARWIGAPMTEITYICAGINHMAWYLKYKWKGKDAYPLLREAIAEARRSTTRRSSATRCSWHLDYYVTESSGHNSEYNWWFRKRPDLIEKYCIHGTGWNPGEYAYILKRVPAAAAALAEDDREVASDPATPSSWSVGTNTPRTSSMRCLGGEPFEFNGNVPQHRPDHQSAAGCLRRGAGAGQSSRLSTPCTSGPLPQQLVPLVGLTVAVEEMAVEAALTGNARLVYQAIANDPLTAAVLSLEEIRSMVKEMFAASKDHLPQFKCLCI